MSYRRWLASLLWPALRRGDFWMFFGHLKEIASPGYHERLARKILRNSTIK